MVRYVLSKFDDARPCLAVGKPVSRQTFQCSTRSALVLRDFICFVMPFSASYEWCRSCSVQMWRVVSG